MLVTGWVLTRFEILTPYGVKANHVSALNILRTGTEMLNLVGVTTAVSLLRDYLRVPC